MLVLRILAGGRQGETIQLAGDTVTVGRSPENTISLPDDARLSRQHARLVPHQGFWYAEDLNSANGTFLERGGQSYRIAQPTALYDGDVLVIGSMRAGVADVAAAPDGATDTQTLPPVTRGSEARQAGFAAPQPVGPTPQSAAPPAQPVGPTSQPGAFPPPPVAPAAQRGASGGLGGSPDVKIPQAADFQTLVQRLLRVARLDASAFREIAQDHSATVPAVIVVVVASLLSGLGGWLLYLLVISSISRDSGAFILRSVFVGSLAEIVLWFAWVGVALLLLQQVWHRQVSFFPLVRTMGLAYAPVAVSLLAFINGLAMVIGLISMVAAVLLTGVALEAAIEASPAQRLLANLAGFAVFAIALGLLGHNGHYAPGIFAYSF